MSKDQLKMLDHKLWEMGSKLIHRSQDGMFKDLPKTLVLKLNKMLSQVSMYKDQLKMSVPKLWEMDNQ